MTFKKVRIYRLLVLFFGELLLTLDADLSGVSFGALSKAQAELEQEQSDDSNSDSDSDSDGPPEESGSRAGAGRAGPSTGSKFKRGHKHAPAEASSKKPVSWIRSVPGLPSSSSGKSGLYGDIRFDTAYGKADLQRARKNYAFLNEYREAELEDMKGTLANHLGLHAGDKQRLQKQIQAMESRIKTLNDRDFEANVLADYKKSVKTGERKGPLHLKRADKRKLVLSEKFKVMKKKDVDRALERKRKKNTAKERKLMPTERRS